MSKKEYKKKEKAQARFPWQSKLQSSFRQIQKKPFWSRYCAALTE